MRRAWALVVAGACLAAAPASPAADPPRTWALLVGCSEYPFLAQRLGAEAYARRVRLLGPEHDVRALADVLAVDLGVARERITVLAGWSTADPLGNPSRENVLRGLVRLSRAVAPGDRVVFHFAGHGSRVPDTSGDEADGFDEVLLPADVRGWDADAARIPGAILDDEVGERLRAIRDAGATVWAVFDCCHAGTMVRGGDGALRARGLVGDVLGVPPRAVGTGPRARGDADRGALVDGDTRGIAATYAVGAEQRCAEMRLPRGAKDAPWRGLLSWALAEDLRRTKGAGDLAALDRRLADAYVLASFEGARPFSAGDRTISPAGPGAVVAPPPLPFPLPDPRLAVALVDATGGGVDRASLEVAERAAADAVAADPRFPLVDDATAASWLLVRVAPTRWVLRPAALGDGADEAFAPAGLDFVPVLEQIARVENLRRLAAAGSSADPALAPTVALHVVPLRGGASPRRLDDGATLAPGDTLRIDVANRGAVPLDVWLFLLDASFGVSVVFPGDGASPRLAPGGAAPTVEGFVQDASLGTEHLLAIAVAADVAAPPVDLRWLASPPLEQASARARSPGGAGALGDLLAAYAFPSRGGARTPTTSPRGAASVTAYTWTTAWGPVVVPSLPADAVASPPGPPPSDDEPTTWFVGHRRWRAASSGSTPHRDLAWFGGEAVEVAAVAPADALVVADPGGADVFRPERARYAFRFLAGRRVAAYAVTAAGRFDVELADDDGDGWADARRSRGARDGPDAAWSPWVLVRVPWLRAATVRFGTEEEAEHAVRALRALAP